MKTFDIAIIGRGITGLSTALHLNQAGFRNLCMIAPTMASQNNASSNAHFAAVTLQDNMSRLAHNLGSKLALASVELNRKGFASLLDFVRTHKLQHDLGEVLRFADSDHEAQEMAIATKWLTTHGFPAEFRTMNGFTVQRDGAACLSLDGSEILTALSVAAPRHDINDHVMTMTPHASGITLDLASGQKIASEMVILACHQGIKDLLPTMSQALVNHADQFVIFRTKKTIRNANPGDLLLTQHSQFWAIIKTPNLIVAGGAKFLRKWGGVEAVTPDILPHATTAIAKKFAPILGVKQMELETAVGLIDLRACDERPLIGPMFGNSRILLASGYMGSGMTLGFAAGQGLAEFVSHGRSHLIAECFHPSRLRSLPDMD